MLHKKYSAREILALAAGLTITGQAVAGPPLETDDPGILDPGQWEVIAATTVTSTEAGDFYEAPVLDVSFGLTESTQVSAVYPYVFADPDEGSSESDFGNLELGFKWRFWNTEKLQIAVAPLYVFGVNASTARRGIGDDSDVVGLPVLLEVPLGAGRVNASLGYARVDDGSDEWAYGVALAHPVGSRTEVLFEVYGATDTDFDDDVLNFNVGFDTALIPELHLLFSAGSAIRDPDEGEELDFNAYLGLQWFH